MRRYLRTLNDSLTTAMRRYRRTLSHLIIW